MNNSSLNITNCKLPLLVGFATVTTISNANIVAKPSNTIIHRQNSTIEKVENFRRTSSLFSMSQFTLASRTKPSLFDLDKELQPELLVVLNSLNNFFTNFVTSFETNYDPEEGFKLIKVIIASTDTDKVDKYFSFVDHISLTISSKLSDKIIFDLV